MSEERPVISTIRDDIDLNDQTLAPEDCRGTAQHRPLRVPGADRGWHRLSQPAGIAGIRRRRAHRLAGDRLPGRRGTGRGEAEDGARTDGHDGAVHPPFQRHGTQGRRRRHDRHADPYHRARRRSAQAVPARLPPAHVRRDPPRRAGRMGRGHGQDRPAGGQHHRA